MVRVALVKVTQIKVQIHLKEQEPQVKRNTISSSSVRKHTGRPDHLIEYSREI